MDTAVVPADEGLESACESRFGALSEAERRLIRSATKGETAYGGSTPNEKDSSNNPSNAEHWTKDRGVRSDLIRWICADESAKTKIDPKGLNLYACKIAGDLDLSYVKVPFPLSFQHCSLDDTDLSYASLVSVDLSGSRVSSIDAEGANISGDFHLVDGFFAAEGVNLDGITVAGDLDCSGGRVASSAGDSALSVEGGDIHGDLVLANKFSATGEVDLLGVSVGGNLNLSAGTFRNHSGDAISADGAKITGDLGMMHPFHAEGTVRLPGIELRGDLNCTGASFRNSTGDALFADNATIKGNAFLSGKMSATGKIGLTHAQIGGDLDLTDAKLSNPGDTALIVDGVSVGGNVLLTGAFLSRGSVRLRAAQIAGNLYCDDGTFDNESGKDMSAAFDADELAVTNGFLRRCTIKGRASFYHAQIRDNLELTAAHFLTPPMQPQAGGSSVPESLSLERADIGGYLFLRYEKQGAPFIAKGLVKLTGSHVGGQLECEGGEFATVVARFASVGGGLVWRDIALSKATVLDLRGAQVSFLEDDQNSWPAPGNLFLDGFVYSRIAGGPESANLRLDWLHRQSGFRPQPYIQLAKVLKDMGDEEGSREVRLDMTRRSRDADRRRLLWAPERWWRSLTDGLSEETIRYGLYPSHAIWYLAGITGVGWILFRRAKIAGTMAPTDKDAYAEFRSTGHLPAHYAQFNPLIYSIENCIPLVKLGQDELWQADPGAQPQTSSPSSRKFPAMLSRFVAFVSSPVLLRWARWLMIGLGWLLATFFVAGLSGLVESH